MMSQEAEQAENGWNFDLSGYVHVRGLLSTEDTARCRARLMGRARDCPVKDVCRPTLYRSCLLSSIFLIYIKYTGSGVAREITLPSMARRSATAGMTMGGLRPRRRCAGSSQSTPV